MKQISVNELDTGNAGSMNGRQRGAGGDGHRVGQRRSCWRRHRRENSGVQLMSITGGQGDAPLKGAGGAGGVVTDIFPASGIRLPTRHRNPR